MIENTDKPLTVLGMQVHTSPTMPDDAIDIVSAGKRTRFKVEPGPVLQNCWTCRYDSVEESSGCHLCHAFAADGVVDWVDEHVANTGGIASMPPKTADNCPGWKPKPAAIPEHDRPGHRPNVDRAQVAALGVTDGPTLSAMLEQFEPVWGEDPPPRPPPENTDREQLAALGSVPPPEPTIPEVVEALEDMTAETITIKRAAWDALHARVEALERLIAATTHRRAPSNNDTGEQ